MAQPKENTKKLMCRLAGSLVSWLTFQQSALRSRMYSEHGMYSPIFEVASARRWKIRPQFPVKIDGTTKYIDFVFYGITKKHVKNDRVAALEISYIRKRNSESEKISNDESKLRKVRVNDFLNGKYGAIKRYVMIAGKESHLRHYCKSHFKRALPLFKDKPPGNLGWMFRSPIKFSDENLWCVLVLVVPEKESHPKKPTAI
jgi:hypothetical protein